MISFLLKTKAEWNENLNHKMPKNEKFLNKNE